MVREAEGNSVKVDSIKKKQIIGVEYQDDIYALCVSNMIIHGDGKTNIILGDCFEHTDSIRSNNKPDIGLLNPPYKTNPSDKEELDFVLDNLSTLKPGGKCIAIVPLSCALATSGTPYERKQTILHNHTLEAVMSMPEELFHNSKVGVVTCTMVITAHQPHPEHKKTWLGYWRDDGFIKMKSKGRIDVNNKWVSIRDIWITNFLNRETVNESCLMKKLNADDEWCIEAYMDTNYSKLSIKDFKITILDYLSFCIFKEKTSFLENFEKEIIELDLCLDSWEPFDINELFDVSLGRPLHKNSFESTFDRYHPTLIPYVTRTTTKNGVDCYVHPNLIENEYFQEGNAITIGAEGFQAFYQEEKFITGNKINILRNENINLYNALFISTILNLEIHKKFNYGRGLVKSRLETMSLKLPSKNNQPNYQFMENFIKSIKFGVFDNLDLS